MGSSKTVKRSVFLAGLTLSASLLLPSLATASDDPPGCYPSWRIDQYVSDEGSYRDTFLAGEQQVAPTQAFATLDLTHTLGVPALQMTGSISRGEDPSTAADRGQEQEQQGVDRFTVATITTYYDQESLTGNYTRQVEIPTIRLVRDTWSDCSYLIVPSL